MRVSAIIINYNYAAFLERAVRSVAAQTRPADEIIFVDDGSTDDSLARLETLRSEFPSLRVHSQANGGQLAAVRSGLNRARGDWVFLLDSDDEWREDHLEQAEARLVAHPEVSMYFSGHRESSGPPLFRPKWPEGAFGPCAGLVSATGIRVGTIESTLGLRTAVAREALSFDPLIDQEWRMRAEDCLIFGASLSGAVAYHNPAQTVLYRVHGGNSFAHTDQSAKVRRYEENKARLFAHWRERFGVDAMRPYDLIFSEWRDHPRNRRNGALRRRSARALARARQARIKNLLRALRVQLLP